MWLSHTSLLSLFMLSMSLIVTSQSLSYDQLSSRDWPDSLTLSTREPHMLSAPVPLSLAPRTFLRSYTTRELIEEVEDRLVRRALPKLNAANLMQYVKKGTTWIKEMTAADKTRLANFKAKVKALPAARRLMPKAMKNKLDAAAKAAAPKLKAQLAAAAANKDITPKGMKK
ncbi:hypothetical protein CVT24_010965 [Panaeolus cyanescens]|uniref:Uncharacterized protein n=1 Tax=Panaeolus cyanescens TaxID=181874 RepID=A0A409WDG5_9AGAR|nr:hypothetical protein CVT24_010965 [Panaeolus cyanescens]